MQRRISVLWITVKQLEEEDYNEEERMMLGCRKCGAPTTSGYCHICKSQREDICRDCGRRIHDGIRMSERFICRDCFNKSK